jgi:enterobacterial common antigen flippase
MNQDISETPSSPDGNVIVLDSQKGNQTVETAKHNKHTYGQILKSSAIIASSSMINIGIGIARTKAMAMLMGPSGVGLMGLYNSITDLAQSIAGMGINNSGVRQIAEAVGSDDNERIAMTAQVLQRTAFFLGLFGATILFGFSSQLSQLTFGDDRHANGVALLSIAVLFNLVASGQGALIQGMRRISDLAMRGILGAFFGTLASVPLVYYLGEDGVVPSLVIFATINLITSWWYKRKIRIQPFPITSVRIGKEQTALLKLGFAFLASAMMVTGAAYIVRMIVVRKVGFDAAGLYQSAWALGGLYVGLILQSMGTDFYPRLTAIANDHPACNRVVNEQAHVSLLLAGPGVIATLTFAPLIIAVFYTPKFVGAVEILRWLCLGMTLRVVTWPMGYIVLAKGVQNIFFCTELAWTAVYLSLAWFCINAFGLNGAGIAFFASYIFSVFLVYFVVRHLTGFRYSRANLETTGFFFMLIGMVFYSFYDLPPLQAMIFGTTVTLVASVYSIKVLLTFVSKGFIPPRIVKLLGWLQLIATKNE